MKLKSRRYNPKNPPKRGDIVALSNGTIRLNLGDDVDNAWNVHWFLEFEDATELRKLARELQDAASRIDGGTLYDPEQED